MRKVAIQGGLGAYHGRVAELRYGLIKDAESQISRLQIELDQLQNEGAMIDEEVGADDIAEVVARLS